MTLKSDAVLLNHLITLCEKILQVNRNETVQARFFDLKKHKLKMVFLKNYFNRQQIFYKFYWFS